MPDDIRARIEKLLADAADCDLIANLATDERKRINFQRLASQYRALAETLGQDDLPHIQRAG